MMEEEANTGSSFLPLCEGRDLLPLKRSKNIQNVYRLKRFSTNQPIFIVIEDSFGKSSISNEKTRRNLILNLQSSNTNYSDSNLLEVKDDHVYIGGDDVTYVFSEKEIMILSLLKNKNGEFISKEEIAQTLWGSNFVELYSESAITQAMCRIRTKFAGLGLSRFIIRTAHGKGYVLRD